MQVRERDDVALAGMPVISEQLTTVSLFERAVVSGRADFPRPTGISRFHKPVTVTNQKRQTPVSGERYCPAIANGERVGVGRRVVAPTGIENCVGNAGQRLLNGLDKVLYRFGGSPASQVANGLLRRAA